MSDETEHNTETGQKIEAPQMWGETQAGRIMNLLRRPDRPTAVTKEEVKEAEADNMKAATMLASLVDGAVLDYRDYLATYNHHYSLLGPSVKTGQGVSYLLMETKGADESNLLINLQSGFNKDDPDKDAVIYKIVQVDQCDKNGNTVRILTYSLEEGRAYRHDTGAEDKGPDEQLVGAAEIADLAGS